MAKNKGKLNPACVFAGLGWFIQRILLSKLTPAMEIVLCTVVCAVAIVFVCRQNTDFPTPMKIVSLASLVLFAYLPILLPYKAWILFAVLWSVVLAGIILVCKFVVYHNQFDTKHFMGHILYLLIWLVVEANYAYPDKYLFLIYLVPLAAALVTGGICAKAQKYSAKTDKEILHSVLIISVLVFSFTLVGIQQLNFALDTGEPTEYSAVIKGKNVPRIRINQKSENRINHYFLLGVKEGSCDMKVGRSLYRSYEVGDTFSVYRYEGAFGIPFYLEYKK